MKNEFLKVKRNLFFWLVIVIFIGLGIQIILENKKVPEGFDLKPIVIFNVASSNNYFIVLFNSIFAFSFLIFSSILSVVVFQTDIKMFKTPEQFNFKKSKINIVCNKIIFVYVIFIIFYLSIILLYLINLNLLNLKAFSEISPLLFLYFFKYLFNSLLFITIMFFTLSLIKNIWINSIFILGNIASLAFFDKQYTLFNWFLNSLAYITKFIHNRQFDIFSSLNSEIFMIILSFVLIIIYCYNEKFRYKQIRPQ